MWTRSNCDGQDVTHSKRKNKTCASFYGIMRGRRALVLHRARTGARRGTRKPADVKGTRGCQSRPSSSVQQLQSISRSTSRGEDKHELAYLPIKRQSRVQIHDRTTDHDGIHDRTITVSALDGRPSTLCVSVSLAISRARAPVRHERTRYTI